MTDISLPAYSPPIRSLSRVERIAFILAVALVAALVVASIRVEECRIVPGAFSGAFSSAFDVSRKVCDRAAFAVVLAHKIENGVRTLVAQ
jgi:hypothetical protein